VNPGRQYFACLAGIVDDMCSKAGHSKATRVSPFTAAASNLSVRSILVSEYSDTACGLPEQLPVIQPSHLVAAYLFADRRDLAKARMRISQNMPSKSCVATIPSVRTPFRSLSVVVGRVPRVRYKTLAEYSSTIFVLGSVFPKQTSEPGFVTANGCW
jgi:hypothetical protein